MLCFFLWERISSIHALYFWMWWPLHRYTGFLNPISHARGQAQFLERMLAWSAQVERFFQRMKTSFSIRMLRGNGLGCSKLINLPAWGVGHKSLDSLAWNFPVVFSLYCYVVFHFLPTNKYNTTCKSPIGAVLNPHRILYYTILYYTILYYTILYYTILYYTILYYTILYYTILYYTILYYTILYYTILMLSSLLLYHIYINLYTLTTIEIQRDHLQVSQNVSWHHVYSQGSSTSLSQCKSLCLSVCGYNFLACALMTSHASCIICKHKARMIQYKGFVLSEYSVAMEVDISPG